MWQQNEVIAYQNKKFLIKEGVLVNMVNVVGLVWYQLPFMVLAQIIIRYARFVPGV